MVTNISSTNFTDLDREIYLLLRSGDQVVNPLSAVVSETITAADNAIATLPPADPGNGLTTGLLLQITTALNNLNFQNNIIQARANSVNSDFFEKMSIARSAVTIMETVSPTGDPEGLISQAFGSIFGGLNVAAQSTFGVIGTLQGYINAAVDATGIQALADNIPPIVNVLDQYCVFSGNFINSESGFDDDFRSVLRTFGRTVNVQSLASGPCTQNLLRQAISPELRALLNL